MPRGYRKDGTPLGRKTGTQSQPEHVMEPVAETSPQPVASQEAEYDLVPLKVSDTIPVIVTHGDSEHQLKEMILSGTPILKDNAFRRTLGIIPLRAVDVLISMVGQVQNQVGCITRPKYCYIDSSYWSAVHNDPYVTLTEEVDYTTVMEAGHRVRQCEEKLANLIHTAKWLRRTIQAEEAQEQLARERTQVHVSPTKLEAQAKLEGIEGQIPLEENTIHEMKQIVENKVVNVWRFHVSEIE